MVIVVFHNVNMISLRITVWLLTLSRRKWSSQSDSHPAVTEWLTSCGYRVTHILRLQSDSHPTVTEWLTSHGYRVTHILRLQSDSHPTVTEWLTSHGYRVTHILRLQSDSHPAVTEWLTSYGYIHHQNKLTFQNVPQFWDFRSPFGMRDI